jgi:hypothetical protein
VIDQLVIGCLVIGNLVNAGWLREITKSQSSNHEITKSPNHQITKSPIEVIACV